MFSLKKGILTPVVQAGLLATLATLLVACGEQPAPVDTGAAVRIAAAASDVNTNTADLPVVVVTASRTPKSET